MLFGCIKMCSKSGTNKYINAKDILPEHLIKEIQKYVKGQHIYIPQTERNSWGAATGIREEMDNRNEQIFKKYCGGISIIELSQLYNLSEERIKGIIYERRSL